MKFVLGICLCLGVARELAAQPALSVDISGQLGPVISGTGAVVSGTYDSGITAKGSAGQTCVLSFTNGGGSGAQATLQLTSTNTPGTSLSITAPGSGYTTAPTTASVASGSATCSGTATVTTKINDPLGLNGVSFTATTPSSGSGSINPTAVSYNPSSITYNGLTITFSAGALTLPCKNASVTVTVNNPNVGGNDTLSVGNCTFHSLLTAGFNATIAFPAGTIPAPIPLAFTANLIGAESSGTYTVESGTFKNVATTLGITGGISTTCNNCPQVTLNGSTSPAALSFSAQVGGSPPAAQAVAVAAGGDTEPYAVTTSASWITVNNSSSTGGATGGSFNVDVNPSAPGVVAGLNTGTVSVYTAASNSPITIGVNFTVSPVQFNLQPSPSSFTFNSVNGASPQSQSLSVAASTGASVQYTASGSAAWLNVNPSTGTTGGAALSVSAIPASAAAGVNNGNITLTAAGASNSGLQVPVTFNVTTGFSVAPSSLSFSGIVNGSNPPTQQLNVTSSAGPNVPYTAVVTSNSPWLSVTPGGTSNGGPLTVTVTTGSLGANVYNGTITITPTGGASIPVGVTLTMTSLPSLTSNQNSLTFAYSPGAPPASQMLGISSSGAALSFNASTTTNSGGSWLQVAPASNTTGNSETVSINASVVAGLATGTYTGAVILACSPASSCGNANGQLSIPVMLNVTATLTPVPSSVTFHYTIGGSTPAAAPIAVSSNGGAISYTIGAGTSTGGNWLTVSSGSATTPTGFSAGVNASVLTGLGVGTYTGTITLSSAGASNSPVSIPVTLVVSAMLQTSNPSLTFAYQINGATPASQMVTITSSAAPLSQLNITVSSSGTSNNITWLSVSAPAGLATPQTLTVSVSPQGLPSGNYMGSITITSAQAANSPLVIPVSLVVSALPSITTLPSSLSFNYYVNGSVPSAQSVSVGSSGTAFGSVTASTSTPWLAVSSSGASTPLSLSVSLIPANLPATVGNYQGSITITASGTANSPLTYPVTLNVLTQPVLKVNPSSLTFSYTTGTAAPAAQGIAVSTSNGATAAVSMNVSTTMGGNWLQVSPSSGNAPGTFMVSVAPNSLSSGSYSGTVNISASGFTSTSVSVSLTVTQAKAVIQITGVTIFGLANTAPPATSTLAISASDGSAQAFTIAAGPSPNIWAKFSPTSGTTPANVIMTVTPAGLIPGVYVLPITVTMPGLPIPTKTIYAQLTITGSNLAASPSMLSFTYQVGSSFPAAQSVALTTASGSGSVALASITTDVGWIQVTPATSAPATLKVSVNPGLLSAGTYEGDVIVKGVGSPNVSLEIPVSITVTAASQLTAMPATLSFNYQSGGSLPASATVALAAGKEIVNFGITSPGPWLQVTPVRGTTPASLMVTANPAGLPAGVYSGNILVSTFGATNNITIPVAFTITGPPQFTFNPTQLSFTAPVGGPAPATQTLTLASTGAPLSFTAVSGSAWLSVTPASGTTPQMLTISANPTGLAAGAYTGAISVFQAGSAVPQLLLVTLEVGSGSPVPTIAGVINAASGAVGKVAPGMVISIFGSGLGPQVGASFTAPPEGGAVATILSGTQVLFDGNPVPVLYTSNTQVNALVPFELSSKAGTGNTVLNVEYNGATSAGMTLPIVTTLPGLFTLSGTGTGQGAILNQDYSVNGSANPAAAGSAIMIFGTGGGLTNPASTDGALNPISSTGQLTASATATIGGQPATVLYSGPAPGLVSGVFQINLTIPSGTPSGNAQVVVTVGNVASQTVTVAVQ